MLPDGAGDLGGFSSGLGIVAAHDALLVGELHDGLAHEIGLGEVCGTPGQASDLVALPCPTGDLSRKRLHTLDLLAHRAETLLEGDAVEPLDKVVQGDLEVLVIEELGIVEAGAYDALVAGHHRG